MIPERNLMSACGLEDALQHKWVADITDMMDAGPRVILRLPKIQQAIICHPEPLLWFSRTRMELEMLALEAMNRTMQRGDKNGVPSDFVGAMILMRQIKLSTEVALRMLQDGRSLNDLNDIVFRILK
ncbi:hypothetical protein DPMN_092500 [Dreissena polymorpha]|uniref:Uncharacterized protein n=1 Tax=Dreissena polymorpha TaxID=45954 RepID=A0A9D4R080_DREPO|nr:hypothetical protein DPMN_092500 [Dreissena polymorpha]